MKLIAKKDFSYSTDGCTLVAYSAGTEIDTDNQGLIEVSLAEGWTESPTKKADKAPANKAIKAAPENK
jgi:hypothetical protein